MTQSRQIPAGWKMKQLNQVCENLDNLRKPVTKSDREKGTIPYYGATGIVDHVADYIFDEELLLVGEDGADWSPYANTTYIVRGKTWVNNHAHVLRCIDANIIFLKEYLNWADLRIYTTGTTRGKLTKGSLDEIRFFLPSNDEQTRIAAILSKVDSEIEKVERIIEQTEKLKKGLMQTLLTKGIGHTKFKKTELGEIPEEWEVIKFSEICELVKTKIDPKTTKESVYIGLEHIDQKTGQILGTGLSTDTLSIKSKFDTNDVLFGKLRPYLKKFWLAKFAGVCSTEILVFRPKRLIEPVLLFYYVQDDGFINHSISNSFGTKMPRTDWKTIKTFQIALPKNEEQKKIVKILSLLDSKISINQQIKSRFLKLKKGLMDDLLSGKVRANH
ncbi:restriction endonuclease subunit S [Candidatus Peregrinibacteria bacterium]|nr:restriction endonuclease subunit S [Candidatus Peregrinibacteria bacterium]